MAHQLAVFRLQIQMKMKTISEAHCPVCAVPSFAQSWDQLSVHYFS